MCKDRVLGIAHVRTPDVLASTDHNGVLGTCAAFCVHDVVITVFFINMRTFGPDTAFECAVPNVLLLADFPVFKIYFGDVNVPVSVVLGTSVGIGMGADVIALSVLVKEKRRVYSVSILEIMRL